MIDKRARVDAGAAADIKDAARGDVGERPRQRGAEEQSPRVHGRRNRAGVSALNVYVARSDGWSLLGKIRCAKLGCAAVSEPDGLANQAVARMVLRSAFGSTSRGPDV